jgi:predicted component of type VI protein secretion system
MEAPESKVAAKRTPAQLTSASDVLSYGQIRNRAQAYQLLAEASDFLVRTEPHSPVPYLVRRAIAWGSMSLETLMTDLIRNSNDLSEVSRLLNFGDANKLKPR